MDKKEAIEFVSAVEEQQKKIKTEKRQNKLLSWYEKISFLEQTDEQKTSIALQVKGQLNTGQLYWIEIILSTLIATLGLLQNSVAVIIGAMLIAPLLRPIQGIAYGIAEGRTKMVIQGGILLFWSTAVPISIAYAVVFFLPISGETSEILGRTAPNIFDLFIAMASAVIALLSLSFKKLSESVAGVAMAASLMPPLAVVGIELAFGAYGNAWGGFLLFFTNIVAIIFVGTLIFLFYGFRPHKEDSGKTLRNIGILISMIGIISIPLVTGFQQVALKTRLETQSKQVIAQLLGQKIPAAKLQSLEVKGFSTKDQVSLQGEIKLPENVEFFEEIIDETTDELSEKLNRSVSLDLDVIRTAHLVSLVDDIPALDAEIKKEFREVFAKVLPLGILMQTEVVALPDSPNHWVLKGIYTLPDNKLLSDFEEKKMKDYLNIKFEETQLDFVWVQLAEQKEPQQKELSERDILTNQYQAKVENFLTESAEEAMFENLSVVISEDLNEIEIFTEIHVREDDFDVFSETFESLVQEFETSLSFESAVFDYRVFTYFERGYKAPEPVVPVEEVPAEVVPLEDNEADLREEDLLEVEVE